MPGGRTLAQVTRELVEAMVDGSQYVDAEDTTPLRHWRGMTRSQFERLAEEILVC
jgi:hypothetical protein